jgi:hypothetical protein
MMSRKIINDLDKYLANMNLYQKTSDSPDYEELKRSVNDTWKNKIRDGLILDFKSILSDENIDVEQDNSRFDLNDDDAQGATIWKSFITLSDKNEKIDVVVNFVVNRNNAFIYLGNSHAHLDKYSGASKTLKRLFKLLENNKKVGHFFQTRFYDLNLTG